MPDGVKELKQGRVNPVGVLSFFLAPSLHTDRPLFRIFVFFYSSCGCHSFYKGNWSSYGSLG